MITAIILGTIAAALYVVKYCESLSEEFDKSDLDIQRMLDDAMATKLPARVADFNKWLMGEPCSNDGGCAIMNAASDMCAACRLRLAFHHTVGW